jgi:hypothetical protein
VTTKFSYKCLNIRPACYEYRRGVCSTAPDRHVIPLHFGKKLSSNLLIYHLFVVMIENRLIVAKYFERGLTPVEIWKLVKSIGIERDFVYRTVRRLRDIGSIKDRPRSGRSRSAWTSDRIKRAREKIRGNRGNPARKSAKEENMSRRLVG